MYHSFFHFTLGAYFYISPSKIYHNFQFRQAKWHTRKKLHFLTCLVQENLAFPARFRYWWYMIKAKINFLMFHEVLLYHIPPGTFMAHETLITFKLIARNVRKCNFFCSGIEPTVSNVHTCALYGSSVIAYYYNYLHSIKLMGILIKLLTYS